MALIISAQAVRELLDFKTAIKTMEEAFMELGKGQAVLPTRSGMVLADNSGGIGFMPAYLKESASLGIKIITHMPQNPEKYDLPVIMGLFVLINPENGKVLALIEADILTYYRTASAAAAVSKIMAPHKPEKLAIIGAGRQGSAVLEAMTSVFAFKEIALFDPKQEIIDKFLLNAAKVTQTEVKPARSAAEAVKDADIITTVTPAEKAFLCAGNIKKGSRGSHINAMGSEMPHKYELDPSVYRSASQIIIDSYAQCMASGEFKEAVEQGAIKEYHGVGDLFNGKIKGRASNDEITIFKSTGIAVQDVALGKKVYNLALEKGMGEEFEF